MWHIYWWVLWVVFTDGIGRIFKKHSFKTVYKQQQTIGNLLGNAKYKIKLENQGAYSIECGTCHETYIRETNRRISVKRELKFKIRNKHTRITNRP